MNFCTSSRIGSNILMSILSLSRKNQATLQLIHQDFESRIKLTGVTFTPLAAVIKRERWESTQSAVFDLIQSFFEGSVEVGSKEATVYLGGMG